MPLQKIENYLVARGCDIHKVKDHLIEFRLPGETSRTPGGRLSVARDGSLKMWHRYAERGLAAGEPWQAAGGIRLGDNSTPALATHIDQLSAAKELSALNKVPKFLSVPGQLRSYDPEQVWRVLRPSKSKARQPPDIPVFLRSFPGTPPVPSRDGAPTR